MIRAELMYVLLQQSCYSLQYEIGTIFLSAVQLSNWLGISTNETDVEAVLEANGFPVGTGTDCSQYTPGLPVLHLPNPMKRFRSGYSMGVGQRSDSKTVAAPISLSRRARRSKIGMATRVAQIIIGSSRRFNMPRVTLNAASGASGIGTPSIRN